MNGNYQGYVDSCTVVACNFDLNQKLNRFYRNVLLIANYRCCRAKNDIKILGVENKLIVITTVDGG